MIHYLNLHDAPFQSIKNKLKTIEMRLNDEKRKLINVGDIIVFTNNVTNKTMSCKVINIYPFKNFDELYKNFDKEKLGYLPDEIALPSDMEIYYSKEKILTYGVLGIEISLLSK